MVTTPNLGLRVWNLQTDPYDHEQLADNWAKVDQHDHTSNKGLPITTAAIQDGAITGSKLAGGVTATPNPGSVTLSTLSNDVSTDYGYAFSTDKVVAERVGLIQGSTSAGAIYLFTSGGTAISPVVGATAMMGFYINPGDYLAGSRTTNFRIRAAAGTNGTAPTQDLLFGLYPLTFSGGASSITLTAGSQVASSTATITAPLANSSNNSVVSSTFTLTAGWYTFGFSTTLATAAGSDIAIESSLHMSQV